MGNFQRRAKAFRPNRLFMERALLQEQALAIESERLGKVESLKYDPLEFFRSLRPREGLTGIVVMGKELQEEVLKLLLRAMNTLRQPSFAQNAEEAFHQIHPGGVGGRMVEVHARVALQPALRRIILVNVQVI